MGLNDKQLDEFKKRVFDPFKEAWEIMKDLKTLDIQTDDGMKAYDDKCEAFRKKYDCEIGGSIYRVLLDAASEVSRIEKM